MTLSRETLTRLAGFHTLIGWEGADAREPMGLIEKFAPAGLIFFRRNYPPGGGAQLTDDLGRLKERSLALWGNPLIVALDNEGGTVKRLPEPHIQMPGAPEQAGKGPGYIEDMALEAGRRAIMDTGIWLSPAEG